MKKYLSCLTVFTLLFACGPIQDISRSGPIISTGQIAIVNDTDTSQFLYIGAESTEMYRIDIIPAETWISPHFSGRPHVRLYHNEGQFEEYLLMPGLIYHLYFDKKKSRTDIKMIRNK